MTLAAIAVHFILWKNMPGQIGIAAGSGAAEHLLLMTPMGGCKEGLRIYSGRFGELEAAIELLARSRVCAN